jgi:hypothetical protein
VDDAQQRAKAAEVDAEVVRQVEFYFSDANLPTDDFLLKQVRSNPDGWGACAAAGPSSSPPPSRIFYVCTVLCELDMRVWTLHSSRASAKFGPPAAPAACSAAQSPARLAAQ